MTELNAPIAPANTVDLGSAVAAKCEAAKARRVGGYWPDDAAQPAALKAAGDYVIIGLRDDSDEALVEAWSEAFEIEREIASDSNVSASWAAAEAMNSEGLIEIIDET